jgi:hypothetical protein
MPVVRQDFWLSSNLGVALGGASVYVCSQPANTTSVPPSPLATLYTDSTGTMTLSQPLSTDGNGHAVAYMPSAIYTVTYQHPLVGSIILPDQNVTLPGGQPVGMNAEIPVGTKNGVNTIFTLSQAPSPPQSLSLYINGVFQTAYSLTGTVINYTTPPRTGDQLYATYIT